MAIWFEEDFSGGSIGDSIWTGNNPTNFTNPSTSAGYTTFAEVEEGVMGARHRSTGWSRLELEFYEREEVRIGGRVLFEDVENPAITAVWFIALLKNGDAGTSQADLILRNNSANQGTRYPAVRNAFTYVNPVLTSIAIEPNTKLSFEIYLNGLDFTVDLWWGENTSIQPDYSWSGTLSTAVDRILFGPDTNSGVSGILYDVWGSDGERRNDEPPVATIHWAHNGSARHDKFLVSSRVSDAEDVKLEYSLNDDFTAAEISPRSEIVASGYYHLEAIDLDPDETYYWRLVVNGNPTNTTGQTKTLPAPNTPMSMSLIWGSCYWSNASGVFPNMVARDPNLVIHLGDDGYTFYSGGETNPNPGQPYPAPNDISLIRSIRDEVFTREGRRLVTGTFPVDHMYSDCDGLGGNMDSTQAPASVVQQAWRQMYAHYLDDVNTGFRTFVVGRVRFIIMDENTASDAKNGPHSESKSKIGLTQKALLFDALDHAALDQHLVLLFADGPWLGVRDSSLNNTGNGYNKYDDERTEIGEYIEECIAQGMLGFHRYHGDDHTLYADSGANNPWGGFPVYCAAPMQETSNTGTTATYDLGKYPSTVEEAGASRHYGFLELTDDGTTIEVRSRGMRSTAANPIDTAIYDHTVQYRVEKSYPFGNDVETVLMGETEVVGLYMGENQLWTRD